jgi:hypothetical protein
MHSLYKPKTNFGPSNSDIFLFAQEICENGLAQSLIILAPIVDSSGILAASSHHVDQRRDSPPPFFSDHAILRATFLRE